MRLRRYAYFCGAPPTPLSGAVITSHSGTLIEGSTVTLNVSWGGGVAPFNISVSGGSGGGATGVSGNSTFVDTTAVATSYGYSVTVTDATGKTSTSAFYSAPTIYVAAGSATYYFDQGSKIATFYCGASGNPFPSIAWYVSINGGGFQYWSGSTAWSSGAFDTATTIQAYYQATNSAGVRQSNMVYVTYYG